MVLGTVMGRHEMPVDGYVLAEVADSADIAGIEAAVFDRLNSLVTVNSGVGICANMLEDGMVKRADARLVLYVTGLTAVTVACIKWAVSAGCPLTLKHFDRVSCDYVDQVVVPEF